MTTQECRASELKEIPIIGNDMIHIKDYRPFVSEELKKYKDWGVFVIFVADVDHDGSISTHVVGLYPDSFTDAQILDKFKQISEKISIDNLRIFLAGLGTVREVGALNSGVLFLGMEDGSVLETVDSQIGASLALLVDDPEVKKQLQTERLDVNNPRINILY